jgi:RimJ/RimL family protein N-acetyltransferase
VTRLRPIELGDLSILDQQYAGPETAGEFNWFGFLPRRSLRDRIETNENISERHGNFAVVDEGGMVVGDVSWHRVDHAPPPNGLCWNIGVWIHPDARGRGHGTAAQRALVEYLFAHTTVERIEAGTELDNVAEQRALEKAGFTREGVLRRAVFRAGDYHDDVVYSILRDEL